jgi:hypothetical protein
MHRNPIGWPDAWLADEMRATGRWQYALDEADNDRIVQAVEQVHKRGLSVPFPIDAFPLGRFVARLAALRDEVERGTGVMLVRGLGVERLGLEGTRIAYWGIGLHLGAPLAQNPAGDLLVDVRNEGGDYLGQPTMRAYHTAQTLPFHNDQGSVVGLLCRQTARAGGLSCIASAAAIHDEILRTRPDLLEVLYGPFHVDLRGEEPPGRPPYYVEPRFAWFQGRFYAQHGPTYVRSAQRFPEVPRLSDAQVEAMALIDRLAASDRFRLDMDFRPGDIQFLNNHRVLHSRTEFQDHEAPERRRHLLRLWLSTPRYLEVPPFFEPRYRDMAFWAAHPGVAVTAGATRTAPR